VRHESSPGIALMARASDPTMVISLVIDSFAGGLRTARTVKFCERRPSTRGG
jgi:hypothetical protein